MAFPSPEKRDWSKAKYVETAKRLRSLGYKVKLNGRSTPSAHQKAIVRVLYNERAPILTYQHEVTKKIRHIEVPILDHFGRVQFQNNSLITKPEDWGFVFKKLTRSESKKLKQILSPSVFTPGGVFIEKPARVPLSDFSVKIVKDGLEVRTGEIKEIILPIDPILLAKDPEAAAKEALGTRKPKSIRIMVNGFHSKNERTLKQFYYYTENILPDIFEDVDEEGNDEYGHAKTNLFSLVITYGKQEKKSSKKKRRAKKRRNNRNHNPF